MPLHQITFDEIRSACQRKAESTERWLRRLVDDQLAAKFGADYLVSSNVFDTGVKKKVAKRLRDKPSTYARPIDATDFGDLKNVICDPANYEYFKDALGEAFPLGEAMAKVVLERFIAARNSLSHGNHVSVHDAERVLCYSDDITSSLKAYYAGSKMDEYNTPTMTRFRDSLKHDADLIEPTNNLDYREEAPLHPGEVVRFEVEVDPAFSPADYTLKWSVSCPQSKRMKPDDGEGSSYVLNVDIRHVTSDFCVTCYLVYKGEYNRFGSYDSHLQLRFKVLPPLPASSK